MARQRDRQTDRDRHLGRQTNWTDSYADRQRQTAMQTETDSGANRQPAGRQAHRLTEADRKAM